MRNLVVIPDPNSELELLHFHYIDYLVYLQV